MPGHAHVRKTSKPMAGRGIKLHEATTPNRSPSKNSYWTSYPPMIDTLKRDLGVTASNPKRNSITSPESALAGADPDRGSAGTGGRWLCACTAADTDGSGPPAQRPAGDICPGRSGYRHGLHHHPSRRSNRHDQPGARPWFALRAVLHCRDRWPVAGRARPGHRARRGRNGCPNCASSGDAAARTCGISRL